MFEMPQFETLTVDVSDRAATVRLNRPKSLNAVSFDMLRDLVALCGWLDTADDIDFVIFAGEGRFFAAGQDLKELHALVEADGGKTGRYVTRLTQEAMSKIENLEQITFAAIERPAIGAGVALSMAADFRVMADDAYLGLPETKIGLYLSYGAMPRLVRAVGAAKAKELIMFAVDVDAEQAGELGLVEHVVPAEEVMNKTVELIDVLKTRSIAALRITKRLALASNVANAGDIMVTESEVANGAFQGGEIAERLGAMLNKGKKA